jgi:hypothetical protein
MRPHDVRSDVRNKDVRRANPARRPPRARDRRRQRAAPYTAAVPSSHYRRKTLTGNRGSRASRRSRHERFTTGSLRNTVASHFTTSGSLRNTVASHFASHPGGASLHPQHGRSPTRPRIASRCRRRSEPQRLHRPLATTPGGQPSSAHRTQGACWNAKRFDRPRKFDQVQAAQDATRARSPPPQPRSNEAMRRNRVNCRPRADRSAFQNAERSDRPRKFDQVQAAQGATRARSPPPQPRSNEAMRRNWVNCRPRADPSAC